MYKIIFLEYIRIKVNSNATFSDISIEYSPSPYVSRFQTPNSQLKIKWEPKIQKNPNFGLGVSPR